MARSTSPLTVALGGIAAIAAGCLAWATLVERRMFTLRRVEIPVLPAGATPIRILHLSDLHMAPWQRDKQAWVRSLAKENPDLIVNTGDNLGHLDGIPGIELAFADFGDIPGVYVNGSNDYYGPVRKNWFRYFAGPSSQGRTPRRPRNLDTARLERFFTAGLGWKSLNNRVDAIDIHGTHISLFGVDDPHIGFDRLDVLTGLIDGAHDDETLDPEQPEQEITLAVAHAPYQRVLNSFVTHGADVILAGHTHGGQVCIPGFGALVTNCDIPRKNVRGLSLWRHAFRSAFLNVSAGLGTSIYAPVRFACRPEASLITLMPAK